MVLLSPADNEKRLVKKCRELNAEIVSNAAKVGLTPTQRRPEGACMLCYGRTSDLI